MMWTCKKMCDMNIRYWGRAAQIESSDRRQPAYTAVRREENMRERSLHIKKVCVCDVDE